MPQYRKLHTKVTQSFDFNEMPDDFTRCLWLLLPLALDCEGRGIYNASWIKAKLMPLREDIDNSPILAAMEWFTNRMMIEVYSVDRRKYFLIPTFKQYQTGTEKETKSILPAPPSDNHSIPTQELVESNSRPTTEQVGAAVSVSVSAYESAYESASECVKEISNTFQVYENEIGVLTAGISDRLKEAEEEYSPPWVVDALHEAATHNKRSWSYAMGILKRWKVDGHLTDRRSISPPPIIGSWQTINGENVFVEGAI